MNHVLYLTYDGILEPLGYSQILSYLKSLSNNNKITIISIEKNHDLQNIVHLKKIKNILSEFNIEWKYFIYKKNKFDKLFLILNIILNTYFIIIQKKIKIVHSRSYVMGLIAYLLNFIISFSLIFDIRGFWIEERVEWGLWKKKSLKYFFFKFFENKIYNKSKVIITLTTDAKKILLNKKLNNLNNTNIYVIPTCVELNKNKKLHNINDPIKFTHLGALGSRYDFNMYLKIMTKILEKRNVFLSIINKGEHKKVNYLLKKYNINNKNYEIKYVSPYSINDEIKNSNFGIFFPVKGFYLNAYFPTKLGEFLSNGIPIITCSINNHVNTIIKKNKIGVIIEDLDNFNFEKFYHEINIILNDIHISERCINTAKKYFDIKIANKIYSKIYRSLN
jgi:hypothetical protein